VYDMEVQKVRSNCDSAPERMSPVGKPAMIEDRSLLSWGQEKGNFGRRVENFGGRVGVNAHPQGNNR
jgi:hypothetical protein